MTYNFENILNMWNFDKDSGVNSLKSECRSIYVATVCYSESANKYYCCVWTHDADVYSEFYELDYEQALFKTSMLYLRYLKDNPTSRELLGESFYSIGFNF